MKFLNDIGLLYLIEGLKTIINSKADRSYVDDEIAKMGLPGESQGPFTWAELKGSLTWGEL